MAKVERAVWSSWVNYSESGELRSSQKKVSRGKTSGFSSFLSFSHKRVIGSPPQFLTDLAQNFFGNSQIVWL